MQEVIREYTVVDVRKATFARGTGNRTDVAEAGEQAPPEVLQRFEGRLFTLHELEQRGVRIAGGKAVYTANGSDWLLKLFPGLD